MNAEVSVEADAKEFLAGEPADLSRTTSRPAIAWRRALVWFVLTIGLVAVVVGASAFAYDRMHAGRILPGIEVAGVDVGGMERDAAESAIRAALPDLRSGALTIELGDGKVATIPFASVGRDYDMERMLDQALTLGRDGGIVEELRTLTHGISVPLGITWNSQALMDRVNEIADAQRATAADARIEFRNGRYVVVPSVDGATIDEQQIYRSAAAFVADTTVTTGSVSVETETIPAAIRTADAQAAVDSFERTVSDPLTVIAADHSVTADADVIRGWVRLVGTGPGTWAVEVESGPITQMVEGIRPLVDVEPVDASLAFEQGEPQVTPATNGRRLDVRAGISAVVDAVEGRTTGTSASTVRLAVTPLTPEFSTADAQAIAARFELLGTWTTKFSPSPSNGDGANIKTPARLIDGTVLEPGEMFDFIDAAGPFTTRNGYLEGGAIIHGRTQPDGIIGGGLCSAATTLFNAAARAGFQIDARHNHSYYIGRYPVGLDATIWQNGRIRKTFAFTNDSDYPILIRATTTRRKVTFEIWGISDGRKVSFSDPTIEDEKEARQFIEYTDELPAGEAERVEWAVDGFDSWVTRTVRAANGAVMHRDTFFSDYRRVDGIVEVGRLPDDPPAGTREEF